MIMRGREAADDFERELRRSLYRFDCPEPLRLGEYELNLLEPEERTRIAAHAVGCEECRAELRTLREFLASPTSMPEPVLTRARRLIATLLTPSPGLAYGGLRGDADTSTRTYAGEDVSVSLGPGQTPGSLLGLVVAPSEPPGWLDGREVRLTARDGWLLSTRVDDLGNFRLETVSPGLYTLELDLPDAVLVVEELRVG